jgi:hypothetical protein
VNKTGMDDVKSLDDILKGVKNVKIHTDTRRYHLHAGWNNVKQKFLMNDQGLVDFKKMRDHSPKEIAKAFVEPFEKVLKDTYNVDLSNVNDHELKNQIYQVVFGLEERGLEQAISRLGDQFNDEQFLQISESTIRRINDNNRDRYLMDIKRQNHLDPIMEELINPYKPKGTTVDKELLGEEDLRAILEAEARGQLNKDYFERQPYIVRKEKEEKKK